MTDVSSRIPAAVKWAYTAFVAVLVPIYWRDYGPTNFLYFCDVALLLTVVALWRESSLAASIALAGILLPQTVWMVDLVCELFGLTLTGLTGYMFDEGRPLPTRLLSLFHFWLPLLLLWIVRRLGYDRRAWAWCTVGGTVLVLVCYFWMPPPPAPPERPNLPVNINYVYGLGSKAPQSWLPQPAYVALLLVVLPAAVYGPAHWLLARIFPRPAAS